MNKENKKTIIFVVVQFVLLGVAIYFYPRDETVSQDDELNTAMFEEFDPGKARSLDIVKYDSGSNKFTEFSVEQTGRGWVIPSHHNYPADANDQMREAANSLLDLTILDVKTDNEEDHESYGVLDPDKNDVKVGQAGVGVRVMLKDRAKKPLASLIVGNAVKDNETRRYVRKPEQRRVYEIEYSLDVLKTNFRDWIEKDLLKLDVFNVENVVLKQYQVDPNRVLQQGVAVTTNTLDAKFSFADNAWSLGELLEYNEKNEPTAVALAVSETINQESLNALKTELGDLEIVDVQRKPEGLGANLKSGDRLLSSQEDALSLIQRGFVPIKNGLMATNGELQVGLKSGVVYHLFFGNISGSKEGDEGKINRYMMVNTLVETSKFEMPIKEKLPPLESFGKAPSTSDGAPAPTGAAPAPKPGEQASEGDATPAPVKLDEETPEEKREKERQRIEKDYQRALDARDEQIKLAQGQSDQLNARFADWYYVISEDSFEKLNLDKSDLVKLKEAAAPAVPQGVPGLPGGLQGLIPQGLPPM